MRFACSLLVLCLAAGPGLATHVPFVGCASDGQTGPRPIPRAKLTPDLPPAAAAQISYYVRPNNAVLAPRGWRCFETYGSNGQTLFVAPHPIGSIGHIRLTGPAVMLSVSFGGTSGRFGVAEIAGRLFPAAKPFVDRVEAEGMTDKPFFRHPYPTDKITYRSPYEALVTTPANRDGIGTSSLLPKGALPVDSIVRLRDPKGDSDLIHMSARLAPQQRPLVAYIIAQVAKER